MLGKSISKNSAILAAFAAVTAGLIAFTFQSTVARIVDAERRAAQRALFEIVPQQRHDNDLLSDTLVIPQPDANLLGMESPALVHVARYQGEPVAFVVPTTTPDGYSGDIKLLVGVNVNGSVAGVRVVSHKETPGLGDKIELIRDSWILAFDGKSLTDPLHEKWAVKKDGGHFDQFAGATITPRAVVHQVKTVVEYLEKNRDSLLSKASQTEVPAP